ncbi:MAG: BamA/TamA family outer membrane protein [Deltaproteobacteria bacterium]|nr:BamA/TamA family outer membrane protein [Deltaproteobacteria bacterium]
MSETPRLVKEDPAGPVPLPRIPEPLRLDAQRYAEYAAETDAAQHDRDVTAVYAYKVEVTAPDAPEIEALFRSASLLEQLRDDPPESMTKLDMRVKADLETSREVLDALGYYEGAAYYRYIRHDDESGSGAAAPDASGQAGEPERKNVTVQMRFRPGPRYTLAKSTIIFKDAAEIFKDIPARPRNAARPTQLDSLADVGLPDGSFAIAEDILSAVDRTLALLHDNGYPFAEITGTRYIADYDQKTLEAEITAEAGPLCRMGTLKISGEYNVSPEYIESLRTWRTGRIWSDAALERFGSALRETGLFQTINLKPEDAPDEHGLLTVNLELSPAPERTVSGALKYNSDFGAGVQASWTHRNLTGHGDRFNLELPLWQDMQILFAQYRLPFFGDTSQDFVAQGAVRDENVDAYSLRSVSAAAGIERRFSRRLSGSVKMSGEGGKLETPDEEEETDYWMFGLPASLTYSHSNNFMDASEGFKINLLAAPYIGSYKSDFTALRGRIDFSAYLPLMPDKGDDKLVMALKAGIGSVLGANSDKIPSTIRFYSGGGGSVRGYAYQSLGPRNRNNDPFGGASIFECSAEARWKIDQTWGVVAFIDGGMVYHSAAPDLAEELRWGAGLGLRYYTVIGPVRFDVATPLNARSSDALIQLYISIGQSF